MSLDILPAQTTAGEGVQRTRPEQTVMDGLLGGFMFGYSIGQFLEPVHVFNYDQQDALKNRDEVSSPTAGLQNYRR